MKMAAAAVILATGLVACQATAAPATEPVASTGSGQVILVGKNERDLVNPGTIWRYAETWQTDVARTEGNELVRVEPYVWRKPAPGGTPRKGPFVVATTQKIIGSAFPPTEWRNVDFDDSAWLRQDGTGEKHYRSLALVCLRGKFEVLDTRKAADLNLELSFQGGAVAYLNGQEIGREGLPAGKLTPETLANDYPKEVDESSRKDWFGLIPQVLPKGADDATTKRYQQRFRTLNAKIPKSLLRKGINVLAIEIHRAPAHPAMFTELGADWAGQVDSQKDYVWNRCAAYSIRLAAPGAAGGIVPNTERPKGLQVWNASTTMRLRPSLFGDPNEPLRPVRLVGLRNGTYAGMVVVSAPNAIQGFKASISALQNKGGGALPADSVKLGFAKWHYFAGDGTPGGPCTQFDTLEPGAPAEVPGDLPLWRTWSIISPAYKCAMQPVWISVRIPRDAKPGAYAGTLSIAATGEKTVEVPVQVEVAGEWALPDPKDFHFMVGMYESPESVALYYNVPMWSEEHWKLLDQVFALMAEAGVDDLHIPLLARSNLSNDYSMVRWIKQADGTHKPDFRIVERYVELAAKHLGKKLMVVFWVHDWPFYRSEMTDGLWTGLRRKPGGDLPLPCTEVDPAGKLGEIQAPQWGTPEAITFWKPVIEGCTSLMKKRGMEKTMLFGTLTDARMPDKLMADCKTLAPDVLWYMRVHRNYCSNRIGYLNWAQWILSGADVMTVNFDPEQADSRYYRWRSPANNIPMRVTTGAWLMNPPANPVVFRLAAETVMLRAPENTAVHGIGCQGADYWPVLKKSEDKNVICDSLLERYTGDGGIDQSMATYAFFGPGKDGPVPTAHLRLFQAALQDFEARMFVQDALLDHADKLGPDLARRCKETCDERTRQFHHYSACTTCIGSYSYIFFDSTFNEEWYDKNTAQLCRLTAEVAKALGAR